MLWQMRLALAVSAIAFAASALSDDKVANDDTLLREARDIAAWVNSPEEASADTALLANKNEKEQDTPFAKAWRSSAETDVNIPALEDPVTAPPEAAVAPEGAATAPSALADDAGPAEAAAPEGASSAAPSDVAEATSLAKDAGP